MISKIAKAIVKSEALGTKVGEDPIRKIVFSSDFDANELELENGNDDSNVEYSQSKRKKNDETEISILLYDKIMKKVNHEARKDLSNSSNNITFDDFNFNVKKEYEDYMPSFTKGDKDTGTSIIVDSNSSDVIEINDEADLIEKDYESIQRLVNLGFSNEYATMVYISCNKDENAAAEHLLLSTGS